MKSTKAVNFWINYIYGVYPMEILRHWSIVSFLQCICSCLVQWLSDLLYFVLWYDAPAIGSTTPTTISLDELFVLEDFLVSSRAEVGFQAFILFSANFIKKRKYATNSRNLLEVFIRSFIISYLIGSYYLQFTHHVTVRNATAGTHTDTIFTGNLRSSQVVALDELFPATNNRAGRRAARTPARSSRMTE